MASLNPERERRESRYWWMLGDNAMPIYVEGLSCAPSNPDCWWFPTRGYSIQESRLYASKHEAIQAGIDRLQGERDRINSNLDALYEALAAHA